MGCGPNKKSKNSGNPASAANADIPYKVPANEPPKQKTVSSPTRGLALGSKDVIVTENTTDIKDFYEIGARIGKGTQFSRVIW